MERARKRERTVSSKCRDSEGEDFSLLLQAERFLIIFAVEALKVVLVALERDCSFECCGV